MLGVRLTKTNKGTWTLPVVEDLQTNKQVVVEGTTFPANIWRLWSDGNLNQEGLARVDDKTVLIAGKERANTFTDAYKKFRIKRTYDLRDIPAGTSQRRLLSKVNGKRNSIIHADITVTIRGDDYVLQTDSESLELLAGATSAANSNHTFPADFAWRMRDNTDVALNLAEMKTMSGEVFEHANAAHVASRAHKAAIEALTTWAEVDAYDLNAGWPPVAPPAADL